MTGHDTRGQMNRLEREYEIRAVESYQIMVDALKLVRSLAFRHGDVEAIAAIDEALAAAGHPQS